MQIYVCVKHVPDSAVNISIIDNQRIDENITFLLNPYDEHAVTQAIQMASDLSGAEVIAVCLGKQDAQNTLRSALAMGVDRGILVLSEKNHDSIETARALNAAIKQDGTPGLILTGKESIDAEGQQTMFRIGALFDFPVATNVVRLEIAADKAVVDSELSGGAVNTYELSMPCVIGAGRGLNTPQYPTFRDVVTSKKKPVKTIVFSDLNIQPTLSGVHIVELEPLAQKRMPKEITGDPGVVARKIVTLLKDEAKVLG